MTVLIENKNKKLSEIIKKEILNTMLFWLSWFSIYNIVHRNLDYLARVANDFQHQCPRRLRHSLETILTKALKNLQYNVIVSLLIRLQPKQNNPEFDHLGWNTYTYTYE